jgi:hypothetical protein
METVLHLVKRRSKLGKVTREHRNKRLVRNPPQPFLRVSARAVVGSKKAVTLKAAGRHQNKNAKCRIAKRETLWKAFCLVADHQVDSLNIVVVDLPQLSSPVLVGRELFERRRSPHAKQSTELVVPGNPSLADA